MTTAQFLDVAAHALAAGFAAWLLVSSVQRWRRIDRDAATRRRLERGAALVEAALVVALLAGALVVAARPVGVEVRRTLCHAAAALDPAPGRVCD